MPISLVGIVLPSCCIAWTLRAHCVQCPHNQTQLGRNGGNHPAFIQSLHIIGGWWLCPDDHPNIKISEIQNLF